MSNTTSHSASPATLIRNAEREGTDFRYRLNEDGWAELISALARDPALPLLGVWCTGADIHALFLEGGGRALVATTALDTGRYLSLSGVRPAAGLFERAARDLWGADAMEALDARPWLDHGVWPLIWPLSARAVPNDGTPDAPEYRALDALMSRGGEIAHRGTTRGDATGPYRQRLGIEDNQVSKAEFGFGYAHGGIVGRMTGEPCAAAARYAGRIGAGQSVAHQSAFARAVEMASGQMANGETADWRVILGEIERIGTHLLDLGRIGRALDAPLLAGRAECLREALLALCAEKLGHRLLMDLVIPQRNICEFADVASIVTDIAAIVSDNVTGLLALYETMPGLVARARGTGVLASNEAARWALGGVAGRAGGRSFDARRLIGQYRAKGFASAEQRAGDVDARIRLRLREIEGSIRHMRAVLDMPCDNIDFTRGGSGEGIGVAEGPRGDIWYWVKLNADKVARVFIRDPACPMMAMMETLLEGADVEDVELILSSFGISPSAVDL